MPDGLRVILAMIPDPPPREDSWVESTLRELVKEEMKRQDEWQRVGYLMVPRG